MLKHARSEFTESSLREEQAYVFQNPHEQELRRIFEAARVEYGRIDYALKDGAIETWEINLHPTIGRGPGPSKHLVPEELLPLQQQAKEHFYRRFQAAFEAIDVGGEAPRQIAIHDVPEGLRQLRPVARLEEPDGRTSPVRRWLRPLRPLADRLAGAVSPILLRMARLVD